MSRWLSWARAAREMFRVLVGRGGGLPVYNLRRQRPYFRLAVTRGASRLEPPEG